MPRPIGMEELSSGFVDALVRVSAEIVALGLKQVGRQPLVPIAVIEDQCTADRRCGDALLDGRGDHSPPGALSLDHGAFEERVEQQVFQVALLIVGFLDLAEKGRANDATAAPDGGDGPVVEVPVVLRGGSPKSGSVATPIRGSMKPCA